MSRRTSGLVLLLSTVLLAGGAGAAPIVGRVVSARDGTTVAGATVAALDGARTATTDPDGRYRIEGSEALRTLLVTAPRFAGAAAPEPGFTVTYAGAGPYRRDFELRPARPLRGRVVDARFRLRLPPWGRPGLAVIEKDVWPPFAWSAPLVATPGGRVGVRIEAGVRGPIAGEVVDADGHPVGGVEVRAYRELWSGGRPMWLSATTDDAGRFSISGALSEPHRLVAVRWASHEGCDFDLGSEPIAGVFPGGPGHRLVLPTPGAVLVTVEDAEGRPVPDVDVYLDSGRRYPFDVASQLDGVPAVAVKIENGRIVVDDPIADVVPISSRRADDRLRLDRKGRHRIPEIRPGPLRFVVENIRARPADVEVRAEPGRTVRARLRVVLRGRLDVAVTDGAGRPIAGVDVVVLDGAGDPVPVLVRPDVMSSVGGGYRIATVGERVLEQVRTDEHGWTATRYLDPGAYRLRLTRKGFEPWEGPLDVAVGSRLRPSFVLAGGK